MEKGLRMTEYTVQINGIMVSARYSDRAVNEIFVPLLEKWTGMQRAAGRRLLVMLAAPPGAGKSTLVSFLEKLSRERPGLCPMQAVGMDGFHRRQEYLLSHTTVRDGKKISMVEIKGAPVTFDLEKLASAIRKVKSGETCGWPVYDRILHNPMEDALTVDSDIVLLEGNYLLLDEEGWRDISAYADFTVSVSAGEALLRERLIDRKIRTGVAEDAAVRFVDFSDMPNVRLCLEKSKPADLRLQVGEDGDYRIISGLSGSRL